MTICDKAPETMCGKAVHQQNNRPCVCVDNGRMGGRSTRSLLDLLANKSLFFEPPRNQICSFKTLGGVNMFLLPVGDKNDFCMTRRAENHLV